ncbi:MAG: stage III sporulation protein AB [Clostridia bacterium]
MIKLIFFKCIIGGALVLLCTYLGILKGNTYTNREYILRDINNILKRIKNEVNYTQNTMPSSIKEAVIDMNEALKKIFNEIAESMLKDESKEDIVSKIEFIKPYDKQIISSCVNSLGKADIETENLVIDSCINALEVQIEDAKEEKIKNAKLFKSLGTLCGIAIFIILI